MMIGAMMIGGYYGSLASTINTTAHYTRILLHPHTHIHIHTLVLLFSTRLCYPNVPSTELILLFHQFPWFLLAGVMGCGAEEATGLGFVCFCCYQPSCVVSQQSLFWALFVS